jgi:predicted AlkP superfamily pyrophosphatase or phosphodiesterase
MVSRAIVVFAAGCLFLSSTETANRQPDPRVPQLVVLIVVDQMRADYVDRFQSDWTGGLRRLVTEGAWFRRAAYPYLTTVTCAGHATVATGAFPHTHGIIQNAWWARERQAMVTCTSDDQAKNLGYGKAVSGGESAHRLEVPTLSDVMRTERGAHVVTLSLKARSAIMLAGHGGEATWLTDNLDGWETSSAFGEGELIPGIKHYVEANPIDRDVGQVWNRLLPSTRYREIDDAPGEAPPRPWTPTFPHVLRSTANKPDDEFHALWERSPYADAYLGRFAAALVEARQLGKHDTIDVLGVSFSTPDLVGHAFGPRSQEIHDIYAHLDRSVGTLLEQLDHLVGRDRYLVALTADHGVTAIPEQSIAERKDAGRLDSTIIADLIEHAAQSTMGPGKYTARVNGNDIYFLPGIYEKLGASPTALDAIIDALRRTSGVRAVFTAEQARSGANSKEPALRAAALTYFPGRSGDLILVPRPGWMFSASGTTHGTSSDDDQRVPVIFYGTGIKPGMYGDSASPADVAPTIAAIVGVHLARAEGRPLRAALSGHSQ